MANRNNKGVGPYSRSSETLRRPDPDVAGNARGPINKATRLTPGSFQIDDDKLFGDGTNRPGPVPRDGR